MNLHNPNDMMMAQVQRLILHKVQVNVRENISDDLARTITIDPRAADMLADKMAFQLRAFIYGEKVREGSKTVTFKTPATWWDHFKEALLFSKKRWARKFFKPPLWRVESHFVRFEQIECYPQLERHLDPREKEHRITFTQEIL